MTTQYFVNYKNGDVSINTYRFADAQVTDVNDLLKSHDNQSDEILVASIDTDQELQKIKLLLNWIK
jgi:hypothetical protein